MKQLHYLLFLFAISACGSSDTSKESIIDSLITLSKSRDSSLKWINRLKPCVIIENQSTSACSINLFYPIGLKIKIVEKRPEYDDKTFLSVAGV